jgi:hypothetical protein
MEESKKIKPRILLRKTIENNHHSILHEEKSRGINLMMRI